MTTHPPSDLGGKIEELIQKWGGVFHVPMKHEPKGNFVDDLLALYPPPPSREKLGETINDAVGLEIIRKLMEPSPGETKLIGHKLVDSIMAWAEGRTQCDHKGWVGWPSGRIDNVDLSTLPGGCPRCKRP